MVRPETAKQKIKERGLKIYKVAEFIGVEADTLGKFLAGKVNLGRSAQILLCQVLDIKNEAS